MLGDRPNESTNPPTHITFAQPSVWIADDDRPSVPLPLQHGKLDYGSLLEHNAALVEILDSIPKPKYIFTNADLIHAHACLDLIGIKHCFVDIVSFNCMNNAKRNLYGLDPAKKVLCKPDARAYDYALKRMRRATAGTTMFFDDSRPNIKSAKDFGIQTVLVRACVRPRVRVRGSGRVRARAHAKEVTDPSALRFGCCCWDSGWEHGVERRGGLRDR